VRSTRRLVDVPLGVAETALGEGSKGLEQGLGKIDGGVVTTHALVDNLSNLLDTVILDGDRLAAVVVGHDADGQGKDELTLTIVGSTARAGARGRSSSLIVGHLSSARRALAAGAGVARARGRARVGTRAGLGGSLGGLDRGRGSGCGGR